MRRRRLIRIGIRIALGASALAILASIAFWGAARVIPFPEDELRAIPLSTVVRDRAGRVLRIFRAADDAVRIRVDPAEVSPHLVAATIAIEDRRFRSHGGVDLLAVARAAVQNIRGGRIISGASTIPMQVVRLLHPRPRTLASKAIEAFRAIQLERRLTKDEILALYLTLAPYGGDLFGAEAASLAYFGKRAGDLSLAEAALLAGIPQSPSRLRPDRFPERAAERRGRVLDALHAVSYRGADPRAIDEAASHAVRVIRRPFPFLAPHFAQWVAGEVPRGSVVRTTIDGELQTALERELRRGARGLHGVRNAAAVLIENDTGAIRAYAGGLDYFSVEARGQVDCARAVRSPGSALKPFVYALAHERRLLAPDERLADVPLARGSYSPVNFDETFRGLVPAPEALASSLNLPAVRLLERVGAKAAAASLRRAGLSTIGPGEMHGASLALGGCGVRLIDLAGAYAAIARLGIRVAPRWDEDAPPGDATRILSPEACWLIARALEDPGEVDAPRVAGRSPVAIKTGTSWGRRDAWALGFTPRFTAGVWFGNFDSRPAVDLIGARAASPAAKAILAHAERGLPPASFPRPPAIREGPVCAETGLAASPACPQVAPGLLIDGDERTCAVHRIVPIDRATGEIVCGHCAAGKDLARLTVALWPPEVEDFLARHGKPPIPLHAADCPRVPSGRPRIQSPAAGATYAEAPGSTLAFHAIAAPGTRSLFWFVDGALIASGPPDDRPVWIPRRGAHTVTCRDDRGREATVEIACREP
ncbi:MAG: penicillin-binding protein 1C [Planctomycetes bacterium]|nr:penicillin-binding protein 1C [Planctomycetota bacterium]